MTEPDKVPVAASADPVGASLTAPAEYPPASPTQRGLFGVRGSGDTSGFGGLVRRRPAEVESQRPYGGYFDEVVDALEAAFPAFADAIERVVVDRGELTNALDEIWQRVRRLNRYVEERAPWQLAREPDRAGELDQVLASLVEGVRTINVMLEPYMPDSTAKLREALGPQAFYSGTLPPHVPVWLFQRVE